MAQTRREVIEAFIPSSPLVGHLGIEVVSLEPDLARLRLPFRPELATMGDVVHGGAIAALLDTASMAAARGVDLLAEGRAVRRGRSLCFCEVEASGPDGSVIAKALAVHRFG